jgi:mono/diheme cytochrome c family protein
VRFGQSYHKEITMTKTIRIQAVLALTVCLAGATAFAQGDATYKAKCAMCHGAAGVPSAGMASAMGIKPATDPSIKSLTEAQMIAVVKTGKGKMKPVTGLSDAQVKEAVATFRGFAK